MTIETKENAQEYQRKFSSAELAKKVAAAVLVASAKKSTTEVGNILFAKAPKMLKIPKIPTRADLEKMFEIPKSILVDNSAPKVNKIVDLSQQSINALINLSINQPALKEVAKESTQNTVVERLSEIDQSIEKALSFPETISLSTPDIIKALDQFRENTGAKLDNAVRELAGIKNNTLLIDTLRIAFTEYSKTLQKIWSNSADLLQENMYLTNLTKSDVQNQKAWFEYDKNKDIKGDLNSFDSFIIDKNWKEKLYDALLSPTAWMERYRVAVPEKSVIDKAMQSVHATGILMSVLGGAAGAVGMSLTLKSSKLFVKALGKINGFFGNILLPDALKKVEDLTESTSGFSVLGLLSNKLKGFSVGILSVASTLGRVLLFASKLALGVGIVGAIATAMMTFPDQAARLFKALNDIFIKQLLPAFNYIFSEVIGPMVSTLVTDLSSWWNSGGEDSILAIGSFINEVLIVFFGTILPAALKTVGGIIATTISTFAEIYKTITGIFGIGEYGQGTMLENVFGNLGRIPDIIGKWILNVITILSTGLATLLGFQVEWDQSLWYNANVVVNTLAEGIISLVQRLVESLLDWFVDQITFKDRYKMFENFNIGESVGGNASIQPRINGRQIIKTVDQQKIEDNNKELSSVYKAFLNGQRSVTNSPVVIMSAPNNTTTNNSSSTVIGGGSSGPVNTSPDRRSAWENRTGSFPSKY